jgi:hypothetical protein
LKNHNYVYKKSRPAGQGRERKYFEKQKASVFFSKCIFSIENEDFQG